MKKILLISLLFLLPPTLAWSAPAFVNYTTHTCTNTPCYPSSSTSFQYSNVQQGNLLVVATSTSSTGTCTISSSGESWSHDIHAVNSSGVTDSLDIWSLPNANGGNKTINVNCTGGATSIRVDAAQYSGVATSNHVIAKSSNAGRGSTVNAGSVTTGTDNTLLFAVARTDGDAQGWSASSGYTIINNCNAELEPDQKLCMERRVPVSSGTYSGNFTINSDSWVAGVVAYAPAGGQQSTQNVALSPPSNLRTQ
jgi:hypothetical protein